MGVDEFGDATSGTSPNSGAGVLRGQRIGPDGDICWLENNRSYSGPVHCELVSISGLHWDTGDVKAVDSHDIHVGSGYLCLLGGGGIPWCWKWDTDEPQPARVPRGEEFVFLKVAEAHKGISGAGGLVCGQVTSVRVICWTIGTEQPQYQQANHRFVDGSEWVLQHVRDDPARFEVSRRWVREIREFDAFTGREQASQQGGPSILVTETMREPQADAPATLTRRRPR